MDPSQQTAAEYYKHHRKRTLFSRITILSSMAILLIVLAFNISVLYSNDTTTVQSHASTPQNVEKLLPSLPAGCHYLHVGNNVKVACPNPTPDSSSNAATPTISIAVPVNVALPELPNGCSFVTSTNGNKVHCVLSHAPIPTVPVTLPTTCTIANVPNSITCTSGYNQPVTQPLPNLPDGCSYYLGANKYYVVCEAK